MLQLINISDNNIQSELVLSNVNYIEHSKETKRPSIKMVFSGTEAYQLNGRKHNIKSDNFLIVDRNSKIDLNIKNKNGVQGICIFPDQNLIKETFRFKVGHHKELLDKPFDIKDVNLLEKTFSYRENKTGRFLTNHIQPVISEFKLYKNLSLECFFLNLVECMVDDQLALEGKLQNLTSLKKTTKEELYRRVSIAKDFIEDNYSERINIDELAQNVFLSKYHFIRTFKSLYKKSPYQYILKLRLEKAQELLGLDYSFNDVSNLIGFSDEKNLRKAIKKYSIAN